MKRKILIGNWKMNKTIAETIDFVNSYNAIYPQEHKNHNYFLCP